MRSGWLCLWLTLGVLVSGWAAAAPADAPPDITDSARYHALVAEFRCVVCQNRSIAESDAPLAADLRHVVARQMAAGQTNAQIKSYLVARYGDWILYDPPFKFSTWLLWLGPFVLLLVGLVLVVSLMRARRAASPPGKPLDRERLAALLASSDQEQDKPR